MKFTVFSKKFDYNIESPLEKVIHKISANTIQRTKCSNKNLDFIGEVRENAFVIRANVSSATVRRELFNPTVYGVLEERNGITHLYCEMKCDITLLIILLIVWLMVTVYVWIDSNSIINLIIFLLILFGGYMFTMFLLRLNFKDARERLEEIIFNI